MELDGILPNNVDAINLLENLILNEIDNYSIIDDVSAAEYSQGDPHAYPYKYGVRARIGFSDGTFWTNYKSQSPSMFLLTDPYGHVLNPGLDGIIKIQTTDPGVQIFISIDLYIKVPL